jgi:hypothetical protein
LFRDSATFTLLEHAHPPCSWGWRSSCLQYLAPGGSPSCNTNNNDTLSIEPFRNLCGEIGCHCSKRLVSIHESMTLHAEWGIASSAIHPHGAHPRDKIQSGWLDQTLIISRQ